MASHKDGHLYSIPRPKKPKTGREISSSTTLSFSSKLSSLISSSSSSSNSGNLASSSSTITSSTTTAPARFRPNKLKDDIFAKHNKNTASRAAADLLAHNRDAPTTSGSQLDSAAWRRARLKMEEKARLYAALKRGDIEDADEKHMVDFDRKWAETHDEDGNANANANATPKRPGSPSSSSSDGSDSDDDTNNNNNNNTAAARAAARTETVTYTDEFGRTRTGTRREATLHHMRHNASLSAAADLAAMAARPAAPSALIHGDTIQAGAFNPDADRAAAMEALAAARDRGPTPPPDEHYDATREIRNRGTGFFRFSADEQERQREMAFLEKQRAETVRRRGEGGQTDGGGRGSGSVDGGVGGGIGDGVGIGAVGDGDGDGEKVEGKREKRKREIEERRRLVAAKRGKIQAQRFLDSLGDVPEGQTGDEPGDGRRGGGSLVQNEHEHEHVDKTETETKTNTLDG